MTTQSERELTAARWLIDQDDPDFSDAQRAQLIRWLMQSYDNLDTYVQMVRTWRWTVLMYEDEPPLVRRKSRARSSQTQSSRIIALNRRLGGLLRSLREEHGVSQKELAGKVGMRAGEIEEIEVGASALSFLYACLLSRALDIAPSRLASQLEKAISGDAPRSRKRKTS